MNSVLARSLKQLPTICYFSTCGLQRKKFLVKSQHSHLIRKSSTGYIPPLPAFTLGVSGLIPFYAPPLYMIYNDWLFCSDGEIMHLAYSASILSFLGGVRWGLTLSAGSKEIPDWRNLTYSVTPSLLAWIGVLLHSPLGYIPVTVGLLTAGVIDIAWAGYPPWFKLLRSMLTIGALSSIFLLFYVKYKAEKTLGVSKSIEGLKEKYDNWKNDSKDNKE